jgi:xanthine dehydrogenase large subunit
MPLNDVDRSDELPLRHVGKSLPHDSAMRHVQGTALYIDDLPEPEGTLHIAIGGSPVGRGKIIALDLDAVKSAPGVVVVITAADIPGKNDVSPAMGDDPMFADGHVEFVGQALFAVVAETRDAARRAVRLVKSQFEEELPSVTVEDALERNETVLPDYSFGRGDPAGKLSDAPVKLAGQFRIGGQEHFYLEGQVAFAMPGEGGEMHVHSSTQHPTEVQHVVARVLGIADAYVTSEVRRMGGGFGGKESQASQWAAIAALAAHITRKPCKIRLDRDDDMMLTGKRHDFRVDWQLGADSDGVIQAADIVLLARCGYSADLSQGVVDRSMFHADNSYFLPDVKVSSRRLKTNTVSNTAFRGFGGPQGMLAMERMIDALASATGRDPLDIRKANFYRPDCEHTPFGMQVEDHDVLHALVSQLEQSSDYRTRRAKIESFNRESPLIRRGIALTPVKFGISFTLTQMNQGAALVHVYSDGSVHLNHGGTEMGQGLFLKVAQIVAEEFGISMDRIRVMPTSTGKVPNTSPTAASAGTDLNGMAAMLAAQAIKARMAAFAAEVHGVDPTTIIFRDDLVVIGKATIGFSDLAKACHAGRIHLSEASHYKTPKVVWDRPSAVGRPFYYFAYGAACSEVLIDTLTGEMKLERVDILHDVGQSLNPAIDIGQIEGGFVQGLGWLTTEELVYDGKGRLRTHAPSTYKIPVASDIPADFRVALFDGANREDTVYRSKAVGEPPVMLAISVYSAILNAIQSLQPGTPVPLDAPATPEEILKAVQALGGGGGF